MKKIPVGILGVNEPVGKMYLQLLLKHPLFEVVFVTAADIAIGSELSTTIEVREIDAIEKAADSCLFVFSALPDALATIWEIEYAKAGIAVISTSAAFRFDNDIPVIIPEINSDHLQIIKTQQKRRGISGFIVSKASSAVQSCLFPLWPLHKRFSVQSINVTVLESPRNLIGGNSMPPNMIDNILPYISAEEEKIESEPLKIFGHFQGEDIAPISMQIAASCVQVPILRADTSIVSVGFAKKPKAEEIIDAWNSFPGLSLPSAPERPIRYLPEIDRPQPRLDRDAEAGMAVSVGRLRPCPIHDFRFVALANDMIRGAAGSGVLIAEQLLKLGYVDQRGL